MTTIVLSGWHTSVGAGGKGHFYREGEPSCGERKGIWPGVRLADLFTRPTRPTLEDDHLCGYCTKAAPRVCTCWSCQTKRRGGLRP